MIEIRQILTKLIFDNIPGHDKIRWSALSVCPEVISSPSPA
ncbi:hypothetical protein FHW58_002517 [Duganella sp. 1224]|nr:hypothetical protein [Duganella sp. 1224]